ncbi:MAG: hypothetical protein LC791_01650 [Acidobacteria bacterium]|nr:hypothetical protein [Acidobacteriota bacterium]
MKSETHYYLAAFAAVLTALVLRATGFPAPWPAAISLYVYGLVAWPAAQFEIPHASPMTYGLIWFAAALGVVLFEIVGGGVRLTGV